MGFKATRSAYRSRTRGDRALYDRVAGVQCRSRPHRARAAHSFASRGGRPVVNFLWGDIQFPPALAAPRYDGSERGPSANRGLAAHAGFGGGGSRVSRNSATGRRRWGDPGRSRASPDIQSCRRRRGLDDAPPSGQAPGWEEEMGREERPLYLLYPKRGLGEGKGGSLDIPTTREVAPSPTLRQGIAGYDRRPRRERKLAGFLGRRTCVRGRCV